MDRAWTSLTVDEDPPPMASSLGQRALVVIQEWQQRGASLDSWIGSPQQWLSWLSRSPETSRGRGDWEFCMIGS